MILSTEPFYLYDIERLPIIGKKIVRSRVFTLTPFFRSLYDRLSRLLAIALFFSFTPI